MVLRVTWNVVRIVGRIVLSELRVRVPICRIGMLRESSSRGSVWNSIGHSVRSFTFHPASLLRRNNGRRLWSSTQSSQEVRATGAWSGGGWGGLGRLVDGGNLGRHTQALDVRAFSAGSEARARHTQGATIIERRIVSHLSKTASVHTRVRVRQVVGICNGMQIEQVASFNVRI